VLADPPVELHVRVAEDDHPLLDAGDHLGDDLVRDRAGHDLLVAPRRAVAEKRRPEPVDLDANRWLERGDERAPLAGELREVLTVGVSHHEARVSQRAQEVDRLERKRPDRSDVAAEDD